MGDSEKKPGRTRRKRKHPYRRFVWILCAAVAVIGLVYLSLYLRGGKKPASGSGVDDTSVSF